MSNRSVFAAAALVSATIFTAACGGDDGGGTPTPTGAHHHYVVDKVNIPKTMAEADASGLDIDGDKQVDNKLGQGLMTLMNVAHFDIQTSIDTAINAGQISLLPDFQTPDFTTAGGAGIKVHIGSNPMPDPSGCAATPPDATKCGIQLTGSGSFTVATPSDAEVDGKVVAGTFNGGPGDLQLQISLAGATLNLNLISAKVQATGISDDGITSLIVAGAIPEDNIQHDIVPAIQTALNTNIIARDCDATKANTTNYDRCGCATSPSQSTGDLVVSTFDTITMDCNISADEINMNSLAMSILKPDLTLNGVQALSVGLKVSAKKATFTIAGEQ